MLRSLTATILAAAIALSPLGAGPAKALDEKELLGLLAGAAAIAIIAKEFDDRKDERAAEQQRAQQQQAEQHSSASRNLPGRCRLRLEDRQGRVRDVLDPRCLQNNGINLASLPSGCLIEVRTTRGWRGAYVASCLVQQGWSLKATKQDKDTRKHRTLPGQCHFRLEDRDGRYRDVLDPRCLERNDVRLSRLPSGCLTEVRTTRGWRDAYALSCLKKNGWSVDNTRRIGN